jgi:hypothetical protein
MKKFALVLLSLVLIFSVCVFARSKASSEFQDTVSGNNVTNWAPEQNIITANPVGLMFGYFNANYEKAIGKDNGLGFSAGVNFYSLSGWSWFGLNVGAQYDWFFQHHALNGWFAGPNVGISMESFSYDYTDPFTLQTTKSTATGFGVGIGGHGGYRWIWPGGFTLDVTAEITYTIASAVTLNGSTAAFGGMGFGPGVNLGYAW